MLAGAELVAFVAARDLDVSARFYGDVLGLELVESTPFAKVFDARGTTLRVTRTDAPAAAAYTVLGWKVPDIEAAIGALRARGVEFKRYDGLEQDEHGAWTAPGGSRIAWFSDPDANTLSLQQAP
jgi:catechol 2,3-dioxygenase-like lactoylglutathione lyase family enzyme